jgi:Outer membrane protein beta-barrel family/Carboxypeptidase regulatory-like domain
MTRLLYVLTLAVVASNSAQAQNSIRGKILSSEGAVPFATVLLLGSDSSFIKGAISNEGGAFVFENVSDATYLVSASAVGFAKFITQPLHAKEKITTLPDIILHEELRQLDEVVITAEKPLFEQQADRIVINIESSITSAGNTVLEVLQKSPGIVVNRQNNSISMNGKSGVSIMMNGKLLQVSSDVAVQMLDGINASQVEKIELITSPDSKYDAGGHGGIISIATKTDIGAGTNATLGFTGGAKWAEVWGANASVTHRSKNVGFSVDVAHLSTHNMHVTKLGRQSITNPLVSADTYSSRENYTDQQNLSATMEWNVSKRTVLHFGVIGFRRNWRLQGTADDTDRREQDTIRTHMDVTETNRWQSVVTSMGLTSKTGSKGELSLSFDHLYYHNYNPSDYKNKVVNDLDSPEQVIALGKTTPINSIVSRLDYAHRSSDKLTWDAGIKFVTSMLKNDVTAEELIDNNWVGNANFSSNSDLNEQIGAAYTSANYAARGGWTLNGGLRYEYTFTSITSRSDNTSLNRKYGYLFPTVSITKKVSDKKTLSVSYSKRITRPTYNDIAPFVFIWSPGILSSGNTQLWPAVSNGVSATHQLDRWATSIQYTNVNREIVFLQPEPDTSGDGIIYRTHNMKYFKTLSFGNSISGTVTKWWETHGNVLLMYQWAETTHLPVNVKRSRGVINVYFSNSITLPKNSSIELSATFQSTAFWGISYFMPVGSINLGIQKTFGKNNVVRLAADDILNTNNWYIRTSIPGSVRTSFNYHWHNRYIRLTYTWKMGNKELRSVRTNSGSAEEQRRVQ